MDIVCRGHGSNIRHINYYTFLDTRLFDKIKITKIYILIIIFYSILYIKIIEINVLEHIYRSIVYLL